jgi:AsmA protein
MTPSCLLKWTKWMVLATILLAVVFLAMFDWNWLRGPIERMTLEKTGRVLAISGDLKVKFDWFLPHIHASAVTFANPAWAKEKQMVTADAVEITIDFPQLFRRKIVLPEVRLERPVVFLEQDAGGRKNWLLDMNQQDEDAHIQIGRLTLDHGILGYDDAKNETSIRSNISSANAQPGGTVKPGIVFTATGHYKGLPVKADGSGGPVLAMRDEKTPYPLKVGMTVGRTRVQADGTITSLLELSAMDMHFELSGDSIEQLYPLLGIAAPATRAYTTTGHLLHSGNMWRYEKFTGRVGDSDIAGTVQLDRGGKRPFLKAELVSTLLDFADLGPLIGAEPAHVKSASKAVPSTFHPVVLTSAPARVLPDLPFKTDRWDSVDADVTLKAKAIRRAKELPLENLASHLLLRDSVLTLDPLDFGIAGGHLNALITLDGRENPIRAHGKVKVRRILIAKLFPTVELNQTSIGQVNGEFDLDGKGNTVGRMLATANGKAGLIVSGGKVSKLMMEKVGLHLWEILELKLSGDTLVKLRCAVADFDVKEGTMRANALVFDTEITTIIGTGSIDLGQEKLDLTLNQKTKNTSPLALRSPIYIRGSFAKPEAGVDKGRVAVRALGAIALGIVSPVLVLLPLIDAGPGEDSDCGRLVREARALPRPASK